VDNGGPRVLVTGGAGYVGSHACKALAAAGFLPVVYDNLRHGHRWAVKWGPLVEGDLADAAALGQALQSWQPVAVMHFAGLISVGESVADPFRHYRTNVAGSLSLLEAMRAHGVGRIVFSSTAAIYGVPLTVPIPEDHPQQPINPYGATKQVVERMLQEGADAYGLSFVALRYFNAAGADPDAEIGEAHDPETHLIPLVLDAAAGRRAGIDIFGDDYDTPDGTCIRDYIHVADLADAHVGALRWLLGGGQQAFLNLGNGNGFSVREVVETARRVTGRPIPVNIRPRRDGDPPALVGDARAARDLLGWQPQRAALEVQVADAWRWHQRPRPEGGN